MVVDLCHIPVIYELGGRILREQVANPRQADTRSELSDSDSNRLQDVKVHRVE